MEPSDDARPIATLEMFRPPVNHAMRILDRPFFNKKVSLSAAKILDNRHISKYRAELNKSQELLWLDRISNVQFDPFDGTKCLLLKPDVKHDDQSTWSNILHDLIKRKDGKVTPFDLGLNYEYWTYHDIMTSILPKGEYEELPTGFSIVGHVAHFNLREKYLQYKNLIASIIIDKNPGIRTVINKIDDVGTTSEYRTFNYELLAGDPSLAVEIKEEDCYFRFDYSKVYWNTRLNTEHARLVEMFHPGEAVCDVMAGVGPFAVPAGKKGVFVLANDLNPECYASLKDAIWRNKVSEFVKAYNEDGRTFVPLAVRDLVESTASDQSRIRLPIKPAPNRDPQTPKPEPRFVAKPRTFDHFVMNLPATALTFLDVFIGIYKQNEDLFRGSSRRKLPMIHVYCFLKSEERFVGSENPNFSPEAEICREISDRLRHPVTPSTPEVQIVDVRDVAPKKRMFCASFRLPAEVAFR